MERGVFFQLVVTFGTISLMAIGGANAVVPEIHRQVVDILGWMDAPTFARLFAIAQTALGPNVMLASIVGWHVAGTSGLLVATLAADAGLVGYAITAATALVTYRSKVNPLVPMAIGTLAYVLAWNVGIA